MLYYVFLLLKFSKYDYLNKKFDKLNWFFIRHEKVDKAENSIALKYYLDLIDYASISITIGLG